MYWRRLVCHVDKYYNTPCRLVCLICVHCSLACLAYGMTSVSRYMHAKNYKVNCNLCIHELWFAIQIPKYSLYAYTVGLIL